MINHRGGILFFCQNLKLFRENRKFQILNPSSNPNFESLTLLKRMELPESFYNQPISVSGGPIDFHADVLRFKNFLQNFGDLRANFGDFGILVSTSKF